MAKVLNPTTSWATPTWLWDTLTHLATGRLGLCGSITATSLRATLATSRLGLPTSLVQSIPKYVIWCRGDNFFGREWVHDSSKNSLTCTVFETILFLVYTCPTCTIGNLLCWCVWRNCDWPGACRPRHAMDQLWGPWTGQLLRREGLSPKHRKVWFLSA